MPRLIPNDILDLPQTRYIPRLTEAEEYARAPTYKMAGLDTVRAEDLASPEWYEANKQDEIGTIAGLLETVDYFTGAPVRAGLSEMLDNELSPYAAVKGFAQSFTKPGKSPTGKDIAQKIGISPMPFKEAAGLAGLDPDYYPNISPAGMAGLGIEMAADISPLAAMTLPGGRMFHGSPHYWKKPDMSKVGTGEGAQSFGWGLYVTDNVPIAEDYARKLGGKNSMAGYKDVYIDGEIKTKDSIFKKRLKPEEEVIEEVAFSLYEGIDNVKKAKNSVINDYKSKIKFEENPELVKNYNRKIKTLEDLDEKRIRLDSPQPLFYTTEIPKGEYLQWHEKIGTEDFQKIQTHAKKELGYELDLKPGMTGQDLYWEMANREVATLKTPPSAKATSEFLNRAGFTGIQYPAGTLSGVSDSKAMNYVLFNDKDLTVKEIKNLSTGKVEKVGGGVNSLVKEARKYKTADEFVKSQGDTFYNGGGNLKSKTGIYFTPDKNLAESFAKGHGSYRKSVLGEFDKTKKNTAITEAILETKNPKRMAYEGDELTPKDIEKYKKEGFDSVISYQNGDIREIVIFNQSQIKTKEKLIEVWNKAKVEKVGGGMTKEITDLKPDLNKQLSYLPNDVRDKIDEIKVFGSYTRNPNKANDIDIHVKLKKGVGLQEHTDIWDAIEYGFDKKIKGKKIDITVDTGTEQAMGVEKGKGHLLFSSQEIRNIPKLTDF